MTDTLWEFETQRLLVKLEIEPSVDPDTSWMDDEQLAELQDGRLVMFDSICTVYGPRNEVLGQDVLGQSCYYDPTEFVTSHRDKNPMNRNSSIMRAVKGEKTSICHYFPDMVRLACDEARRNVATLRNTYNDFKLRTAA